MWKGDLIVGLEVLFESVRADIFTKIGRCESAFHNIHPDVKVFPILYDILKNLVNV